MDIQDAKAILQGLQPIGLNVQLLPRAFKPGEDGLSSWGWSHVGTIPGPDGEDLPVSVNILAPAARETVRAARAGDGRAADLCRAMARLYSAQRDARQRESRLARVAGLLQELGLSSAIAEGLLEAALAAASNKAAATKAAGRK